jgi:myo-inositol-1(or 4)-monophosphatase
VSEGERLLAVAVAAARLAGGLLAARAQSAAELEVASKSTPTDPVSDADLEAERAIRTLLAEQRPQDGFVGEEGGSESGSSGLSWVVDPLDGTVNYLFGIPQWCVSVAVSDDAGTLAGTIYDPNREELFTAVRGGGARLLAADGEHELRGRAAAPDRGAGARDELAGALLATGFAYDARVREAQARVVARALPRVRDIRRLGSAALDLAWTAAGRYDGYWERTVKPWDIAAGALICSEAGVQVRELPVHEHLPWGILAARPSLAEPLLELLGDP